jgi:hypothetical protein
MAKEEKKTYEVIIYKVLADKPNEWIPSYNLVKVSTKYGWLGSCADRIARYMAEDGKISRKREGKYTYYAVMGEPKQSALFEVQVPRLSKLELMR